jgi:hypothetical protein
MTQGTSTLFSKTCRYAATIQRGYHRGEKVLKGEEKSGNVK